MWKIGQDLTRVWLEMNLEINSQVVHTEESAHTVLLTF